MPDTPEIPAAALHAKCISGRRPASLYRYSSTCLLRSPEHDTLSYAVDIVISPPPSPPYPGDTRSSSSRIMHFRAPPGIIIPFYIIRAAGVSRITTYPHAADSIISPPLAPRRSGDTRRSPLAKCIFGHRPASSYRFPTTLIAAIPGARPPSQAAGSVISSPHADVVGRRHSRDLLIVFRFPFFFSSTISILTCDTIRQSHSSGGPICSPSWLDAR